MKTIYKITMLCAVAALTFSCTDDFEKINTNPNRTTVVDPELLFTGSPVSTMITLNSVSTDFGGEGMQPSVWIFGNYSGHISMVAGPYPQYGSDGKEDALWSNFYLKCINPLVTIEQMKGNDPAFANRLAITKIWKSYVFSQMVALWGPIPYYQACKGMTYTPYDSESVIYKDILEQLKINANALNEDGDKFSANKDPLFNSDIRRWKKFAHTLRLRIAMRLSDYDELEIRSLARAALQEELSSPQNLISNNSENVFMNFAAERAFRNPFNTYTQNNPYAEGAFPVIHEQLMMRLIGYEDPRLEVFCRRAADKYKVGDYLGRPSTTRRPPRTADLINPHENASQESYSYVANEFASAQARWMIISYPEIACIRAEAVYRGFWTGEKDAEAYYYDAIDAFGQGRYISHPSINFSEYKKHWGIRWYKAGDVFRPTPQDTIARIFPTNNPLTPRLNLINSRGAINVYRDYLGISSCVLSDRPGENGSEPDANYKRIIMQHWMALFFQGIDAWTLLRRTQQLQFTPVWNPDNDRGTIYTDRGGSSWGYLPQRLPYPGGEINSNKEARKGIDMLDDRSNSIQAKLKFAKPVAGSTVEILPEYPFGVSFILTH